MTRYSRQTALLEIGEDGQEKLHKAKVLIVDVGGFGSFIALYLAGVGVGIIGLADDDTVSISSLQRQILYAENETGLPKVHCAAKRLQALNSEVNIPIHLFRLSSENACRLIAEYDIIIDGCDNSSARHLISDSCSVLNKPYVHSAIQGLEGQVSVFCHGGQPKTCRDLYPDGAVTLQMPVPDKSVIGVTSAIAGSVEASEVLKLIYGYGDVLTGKLWTVDLRSMQSFVLLIQMVEKIYPNCMKLVVITQLEFFEDEAAVITSLFDAGLEILHLHKPGAFYEDMDKLLRRLLVEYMERTVIHDYLGLASERDSKDVHLNRRNPAAPAGLTGYVSRFCHSLEEVVEYKAACSYVFLSPIRNSISKEGYAAVYTFDDLQKVHRAGIIDSGVVALGGATAKHLPGTNPLGFGGVGLLGDIWQWTGTDFISHFRELLRSASVL